MTSPTKAELVERFRDQIEALQEAAEQFEEGGMNRRAVILLLHDYTRVPKRTIERVLQGVENAVDYYFGEEEDDGG